MDYPNFDQGLVPVVVQDYNTNDVLMVAWMDQQAYERTLESGYAHFYSRSRKQLWKKGETSGNVMRLREIYLDCDADTLLIRVDSAGPACHTGNKTCFFNKVKEFAVN
jgi:phosphoribosyl-AMP cyclohydrolase